MRLKYLVVAGSFIALCNAAWSAQSFKIEPAWSHIEFEVKNFGVNTVEGRFKNFNGMIAYDETDLTHSSVSVSIPVSSIDTGIKKRDEHLQTADFFETAKYPEITFQSQRMEKKETGYVLIGSLTMKGHTQEVQLPFTFSIEKSSDGTPTLRAEVRASINRHDFGINYGSNFSVGKQVQIIIHIQALAVTAYRS